MLLPIACYLLLEKYVVTVNFFLQCQIKLYTLLYNIHLPFRLNVDLYLLPLYLSMYCSYCTIYLDLTLRNLLLQKLFWPLGSTVHLWFHLTHLGKILTCWKLCTIIVHQNQSYFWTALKHFFRKEVQVHRYCYGQMKLV